MEKTDFLNYIDFVLSQKDIAYHSAQDNHFYFIHKNFTFYLKSTASSAELEIREEKERKEYSESFELTESEAKSLTLKYMALVNNKSSYYQNQIKEYGADLLKGSLEELKKLLTTNSLEKEVRKTRNHTHTFVINSLDFVVNFNEILKDEYQKIPTIFLTSMVKLPVYISKPNEKTNLIVCDLDIPSWEIKNYPIIQNNMNVKIFGTDLADKINKIATTFPSGEEFLKEHIDFLLKRSDKKNPVNKI